jgi:hypothetical protein
MAFMIDKDNEKYDHEDHSFSEIVTRNSTCYEISKTEQENIELIEDYLANNKYTSKHMIETHLEHLDVVINKLQNARRTEQSVCPSNEDVDLVLSKLKGLAMQLIEKLKVF